MQINAQPLVSIILLNYKGAEDTIACLQSLQKITYSNYRIIIADNASPDDSMIQISSYLESQSPDDMNIFDSPSKAVLNSSHPRKFTLLQTGCNGGYGYGNNIAIKYALKMRTDYVLVLNNDTVVEPLFLEPMVKMCEEDKNIGIVSGQIFYYDKPEVFWFNGGIFNKYSGKTEHIDWGKKNIGQKPLLDSTFITGCLWLIPKHIFDIVGFINEEYFMYVEDIEFTQRVLENGYALKVSENTRIWHKVGSSSGAELTEFSVYWMTKNKLKYMVENTQFHCWVGFFYTGFFKFFVYWLMIRRYDLIKAQFKGLIHYFYMNRNK